jgi:hypothetical protein
MLRLLILVGSIPAIILFSSCSYQIAPTSAPASNIYSSYDRKIPGRWVLVIDESTIFSRVIKPSSATCSAHKYPFNSGNTILSSIHQTLNNVFDEISLHQTVPSIDAMERNNISGVVLIRLEDFSPRLVFIPGFWSASVEAIVDMSLGIQVRGTKGQLLGTSVGSRKTFESDTGECGNGAEVFAEAYKLALRGLCGKLAERISNSTRIREAMKE